MKIQSCFPLFAAKKSSKYLFHNPHLPFLKKRKTQPGSSFHNTSLELLSILLRILFKGGRKIMGLSMNTLLKVSEKSERTYLGLLGVWKTNRKKPYDQIKMGKINPVVQEQIKPAEQHQIGLGGIRQWSRQGAYWCRWIVPRPQIIGTPDIL